MGAQRIFRRTRRWRRHIDVSTVGARRRGRVDHALRLSHGVAENLSPLDQYRRLGALLSVTAFYDVCGGVCAATRKARGYYTGEELRYFIRRWRDRRALTGTRLAKLSDMKGTRFVFYPLHTEPETALLQLSPEYFYQLSAIAALSRDLPAGVMLAVKETYEAIGRRPADFYGQIPRIQERRSARYARARARCGAPMRRGGHHHRYRRFRGRGPRKAGNHFRSAQPI